MGDGIAYGSFLRGKHMAALRIKAQAFGKDVHAFGMIGMDPIRQNLHTVQILRGHGPPENRQHQPATSWSAAQDTDFAASSAWGRRLGVGATKRTITNPCCSGATIRTSREGSFSSSAARASSSWRTVMAT